MKTYVSLTSFNIVLFYASTLLPRNQLVHIKVKSYYCKLLD